ncbi:hypothetical protein OH764_32420 (plasmid) [Burkholderia sp. M6-3]
MIVLQLIGKGQMLSLRKLLLGAFVTEMAAPRAPPDKKHRTFADNGYYYFLPHMLPDEHTPTEASD